MGLCGGVDGCDMTHFVLHRFTQKFLGADTSRIQPNAGNPVSQSVMPAQDVQSWSATNADQDTEMCAGSCPP